MDRKIRILFPYVEAGMGHISSIEACASAIEAKYGDYIEIIRSYFYRDSGLKGLVKAERKLINQVKTANIFPLYGKIWFIMPSIVGKKIATFFCHNIAIGHVDLGVRHLLSFKPDAVFNTHFETQYYVERAKKQGEKILDITYLPDPITHVLWGTKGDLFLTSCDAATNSAIEKYHTPPEVITQIPYVLNRNIDNVNKGKAYYREKLGFPPDKFTVVLQSGGYAKCGLPQAAKELIKTKLPMTIVVVCGKNKKLLKAMQDAVKSTHPGVTLIPYGFCNNILEINAASDLFIGKGGPNACNEAIHLGLPVIVNGFALTIEKATALSFVNEDKCALIIKNPKKIRAKVEELVQNPDIYNEFKNNAVKARRPNGCDDAADAVWELLKKHFPHLRDVKVKTSEQIIAEE